MADITVTISGNLTDDPELRFTNAGIPVANFDLAVTERRRVDGEWQDGDTSFFRVNAWRQLAENAAETLTKGSRVIVTGTLKERTWEAQDGTNRRKIEITADDLGPSLKWNIYTKEGGTKDSGRKAAANSGRRTGRGRGQDTKASKDGAFADEAPF